MEGRTISTLLGELADLLGDAPSMRFTLPDGREVEMRIAGEASEVAEETTVGVKLTPTQRKILEVLKASRGPLTRGAVAARMGRESADGKFGVYMRELIGRKLVFDDGEEVADDPKKLNSVG